LQLMLQRRTTGDSVPPRETQRRRTRCPACNSERLRQIRRISPINGRTLATESIERNELPQLARAPPP
jgi:hypothetical protein